MFFVPDRFTIINGKADVFDLEEYGLTISFKNDCLPPNLKKCKVFISADLTTDITLPSHSLLVSGVYHITTIPFIEQLNQPIEISMEHCANDLNNLCFVVAKDQNQHKFEYMEGGTFEIEATTGRRIGRISVSSFSIWTTVMRWPQQVWGWLTRQDNTSDEPEVKASISYCGRVYYDDTFSYRKIHFVITKDLPFAKHVRTYIYIVQSLITSHTVLVVLWSKSVGVTAIVYVHAPELHMWFNFTAKSYILIAFLIENCSII